MASAYSRAEWKRASCVRNEGVIQQTKTKSLLSESLLSYGLVDSIAGKSQLHHYSHVFIRPDQKRSDSAVHYAEYVTGRVSHIVDQWLERDIGAIRPEPRKRRFPKAFLRAFTMRAKLRNTEEARLAKAHESLSEALVVW